MNLMRRPARQPEAKEGPMGDGDRNRQVARIELERRQVSIDAKVAELTSAIREAACAGDAAQARGILDALLRLAEVRHIVGDALGSLPVAESGLAKPIYTAGSWFLQDCFQYLVRYEVEALHYVTGVQFGNVFTLDRMVTVEMSHQSAGSAKGDINSTHKALIQIDGFGHALHACFHSHPGRGAGATLPSSIDLDHQARLEKGGYAAIGGIFSRDGFFRAFSLDNSFDFAIYGKGVERVDDRVFRLTEIDQIRG
jgi:hypothetical protein